MSDLIRRQDAINALENHACYGIEELDNLCNASVADSEGWLGGIRDAIKEVQGVPSVEPERKKGKWEFVGDNMFECTHCGVVYTTQQLNGLRNYAADPYAPRFCPNCGAEMSGGE